MFIDYAKITVKAGNGGNGAVTFHREKYVPAGGPDGGDGGKGGDVILKIDDNLTTLMDFKYKTKYIAGDGENGLGGRCFGKDGKSLVIRVPRGTLIRDTETGLIIADMSDKDELVIAKGGRGGWGNSHFATPMRQAPRFAKSGRPGEEKHITLELKLLADVGLIGFPNVGKSSLLSVISAARPKIANYHFTTLIPNIGIVSVDGASFAVADIPGLIEGANEGAGLGFEFLRHVDRCRLLIHVVDAAGSEGRDAVEDYEKINRELALYSKELSGRPQIVAANKCDLITDDASGLERLKAYLKEKNVPVFEISAATHAGVDALMKKTAELLTRLPPIRVYEPEYAGETETETDKEINIRRRDDGAFVVEGKRLMTAIAMVDPDDNESLAYMQRVLRQNGVFEMLEAKGIKEGDIVSINNFEFEYVR